MNAKSFAPSLRVAVVDDDEILCGIVAAALAGLGLADVAQYTCPHELLAAAAARPGRFEVVITDRDMPGMNGLELSRQLRAASYTTQIVLMTANLESLNESTLCRYGISAVLPKPFRLARLETVVRALACEATICSAGVRRAA